MLGVNCLCLFVCEGAWRFLRLKIIHEWFRLFFISTMVHIGKLIEKELRRQERSVTWFANKLCYERTNVYSIFKRQSIDTELLVRISRILNHNFLNYYNKEMNDM